METIELWPFSQGEIDEAPDGFIDAIFARGADLRHASEVSRAEYADRIVRGGFPEAIARSSPRRRERFHDSYVPTWLPGMSGNSPTSSAPCR
jgi:uncharacterized protein